MYLVEPFILGSPFSSVSGSKDSSIASFAVGTREAPFLPEHPRYPKARRLALAMFSSTDR